MALVPRLVRVRIEHFPSFLASDSVLRALDLPTNTKIEYRTHDGHLLGERPSRLPSDEDEDHDSVEELDSSWEMLVPPDRIPKMEHALSMVRGDCGTFASLIRVASVPPPNPEASVSSLGVRISKLEKMTKEIHAFIFNAANEGSSASCRPLSPPSSSNIPPLRLPGQDRVTRQVARIGAALSDQPSKSRHPPDPSHPLASPVASQNPLSLLAPPQAPLPSQPSSPPPPPPLSTPPPPSFPPPSTSASSPPPKRLRFTIPSLPSSVSSDSPPPSSEENAEDQSSTSTMELSSLKAQRGNGMLRELRP